MASPPAAEKPPTTPRKRPDVCGPHAPERPYPIYLRGEVEKGFGRGSKDLGCPTANLPARVVGPGSLLTRTGVYFGFARVLPQDPEDPSITDDEEENEVVLGASPIGETGDGFLQARAPKSRQGSSTNKRLPDKEAEVSMMELSSPSASNPAPASSSATEALAIGSGFTNRKKRRIHLRQEDSKVFPMVMSVGWNPFYKNTHKTAEVHIMHEFADDFYGLEIRVVVLGYIRPEYNYDTMEALIEDIEMDKRVTTNSLARQLYQDYSRDPFLGKPAGFDTQ